MWLADPELVGSGDRLRLATVGLDCRLDDVYVKTWLKRNKR